MPARGLRPLRLTRGAARIACPVIGLYRVVGIIHTGAERQNTSYSNCCLILMKKALVLIDLQYDFLDASGRMPAAADQIEPMLAQIQCAAAAANAAGDPVIGVVNRFARLDPANLFRHFAAVANSPGAMWDKRAPRPNGGTFPKASGSALSNPEFENALRSRQIDEIVLTGVYTSGCVAATAKGGMRRGFKVSLMAPGTADRSEQARQLAILRLERTGVRILESYT